VAHPRSRGEHHCWSSSLNSMAGSPPLTRGAQGVEGAGPAADGLTPAHAGSTPRCRSRATRSRAHPRSRGEHLTDVRKLGARMGSPPLTRGARANDLAASNPSRLTPAHAGSTLRQPRRRRL